MSWLKRERTKILDFIVRLLEERGEMPEEEVIREAMVESWLSRQTVKRYVNDLVFMGRIIRNSDKLSLPKRAEKKE